MSFPAISDELLVQEDANKVVKLAPDWAKGYSRKGAALHGQRQWAEAVKAREIGRGGERKGTQRKGWRRKRRTQGWKGREEEEQDGEELNPGQVYKQGLKLDPDNALLKVGEVLAAEGGRDSP